MLKITFLTFLIRQNEAFMQADWDALPAVGGISIIETFDLRLHPLRLQIERSMGRRVMKYIFSGDLETHRALDHREIGGHHKESPPSRPRVSMDSTPIPTPSTLQRPHTIARSSSFQNLRAAGTSLPQPPPRKLKRMPSSDQLVSRGEELRRPRDATNAVDMEIEEMRARATRNRAFLQIQVSRHVSIDFPSVMSLIAPHSQPNLRTQLQGGHAWLSR